jgi:hypothetical protein
VQHFECGKLLGTKLADSIRASGRACRTDRPDTRLQPDRTRIVRKFLPGRRRPHTYAKPIADRGWTFRKRTYAKDSVCVRPEAQMRSLTVSFRQQCADRAAAAGHVEAAAAAWRGPIRAGRIGSTSCAPARSSSLAGQGSGAGSGLMGCKPARKRRFGEPRSGSSAPGAATDGRPRDNSQSVRPGARRPGAISMLAASHGL